MRKHFQYRTKKLITDLINFNDLQKDVICSFDRPPREPGITPRRYGLAAAGLCIVMRYKDPDLFERRKEAFLGQIGDCWVRKFEEFDDRYSVYFW